MIAVKVHYVAYVTEDEWCALKALAIDMRPALDDAPGAHAISALLEQNGLEALRYVQEELLKRTKQPMF